MVRSRVAREEVRVENGTCHENYEPSLCSSITRYTCTVILGIFLCTERAILSLYRGNYATGRICMCALVRQRESQTWRQLFVLDPRRWIDNGIFVFFARLESDRHTTVIFQVAERGRQTKKKKCRPPKRREFGFPTFRRFFMRLSMLE